MEKITRKVLSNMKLGETKVFHLMDARACESGRTMAYQMQNILHCKLSAKTDFKENILSLTKY